MGDTGSRDVEETSLSSDRIACGTDDVATTPVPSDTDMVRACALVDLADDPAKRFDLVDAAGEAHRIAVIRIEESIYVIGDRCTHADISLAAGGVDADECSIECPRHGSRFLLETGVPTALPAITPVPVYATEVIDGEVFVSLPVQAAEVDPLV